MFNPFSPQKRFEKHAKRAVNRRAYGPDRWESIQFLARLGELRAAEVLLKRFEFTCDPTITDQEEKDAVYEALRALGAQAQPALTKHLLGAKRLSLPLRLASELFEEDAHRELLKTLLEGESSGYVRDPQRKLQLLGSLEAPLDPQLALAVQVFLSDVNESVRFTAVQRLLALESGSEAYDAARAALRELAGREESQRIKQELSEHDIKA